MQANFFIFSCEYVCYCNVLGCVLNLFQYTYRINVLQMIGERALFFATALQLLHSTATHNYAALQHEATQLANTIEQHHLPVPCVKVFPTSSIDNYAKTLLPADISDNLVPLWTTPNGNCLYNAISLLLVGDESMSSELRLRTALALMQLENIIYQDGNEMVQELLSEQILLYDCFAITDYQLRKNTLTRDEIRMVLQNEVVSTLNNTSWSGMWQIQALCTALQVSVLSVYPDANRNIRHLFNRIVTPLLPYEGNIPCIPILWSGNYTSKNQFKPNHFVPLVDRSRITSCLNNGTGSQISKTDYMELQINKTNATKPQVNKTNSVETQINKTDFVGSLINNTKSIEMQINKTFSSVPQINKTKPDRTNNTEKVQSIKHTIIHISPLPTLEGYLPSHSCFYCGQLILVGSPKGIHDGTKEKFCCAFCFAHRMSESPIHKKNIDPGETPTEIQSLNETELHMIQLVHPYMKLAKLPVGGQYAQKGQVINIPMQTHEICSLLPRTPQNEYQVLVESANGFSYQINTQQVFTALQWLTEHNPFYKDVKIKNMDCSFPIPNEFSDLDNREERMDEISVILNDYTLPRVDEKAEVKDLPKIKLPVLTNEPVNIFREPNTEELAFPQLYPYGINAYAKVSGLVTLKQYFTCRLLNCDKRWATCLQYIFWALNIYEQNILQSAISIAVRIGNAKLQAHHILEDSYKQQVTEDFRFMKQIKGTSAYWRCQLQNLMAKIQMLGPPTFFLSLSCNDSNWTDLYQFLDCSLSESDIMALSQTQKRNMVKKNPVRCAIYFSKRWEHFLFKFILGPMEPLGKITDYFARIEFQNRGSPHVHAFFWNPDAPDMETIEGRQKAAVFIDKYISAQLPAENSDMYPLVSKLQIHHHTHTCFKRNKNNVCRFDFPRDPSETTQIQLSNITNTTGRFYKLSRSVDSIWVNPYNEQILKTWNANMDVQVVGCKYAAAAYVCTYVCKNEPDDLKAALSNTIKSLPSSASIRKRLSKIGNILLTHRLISAQEAAFRILNLNLVYSSKDCIYISAFPLEEQFKIVKPKAALKELPADSTDVFAQNIHDLYMRRPKNKQFDQMSLVKFATTYVLLRKNEKIVAKSKLQRHCLIGEPKQWIREKRTQSCFRTYIPNITKDSEKYFSCVLTLFLPWRTYANIKDSFDTYEHAYHGQLEQLDHESLTAFHYHEKLTKAVQQIRALREQTQQDIYCKITPAFMSEELEQENETDIPNTFAFQGTETINQRKDTEQTCFSSDDFKLLAQFNMTDTQYIESLKQCTTKQKQIISFIDESIINNQQEAIQLFVTGGAGTGKSFVLKLIREHMLRHNRGTFPNVLIAAPTGVAAYNVKGWTLHRLLHLNVQNKNNATYHPLSPRMLQKLRRLFCNVSMLIIDEISMVSINTLIHIHKRLQEIKDTQSIPNTFFGNINILAFGDLLQLPPVFGSAIYKDHDDLPVLHLWRDLFKCVELEENVRQKGDTAYARILNRIRIGQQTISDIKFLRSKLLPKSHPQMNIQHMYPTKELCNIHNQLRLRNQSAFDNNTIYRLNAIDEGDGVAENDDDLCGGIPKQIDICIGAQVMLLRNIETSKGLVNGAQGIITNITWANGHSQEFPGQLPSSVDILFFDPSIGNVFDENKHTPITIKPITVNFHSKDHHLMTRTQFPFKVSYAVTIHKVQGLTVPEAAVDIGPNIFRAGMAYVALSRLPSSNGLSIINFCPERIYPSKSALQEMERLQTKLMFKD